MARPPEKLAQSLEILRNLQTAEGAGAIRARDLSRTHRERLLRNGFLQEVIKGWYIPSRPDEVKGESTAWYASFWRFCCRLSGSAFRRAVVPFTGTIAFPSCRQLDRARPTRGAVAARGQQGHQTPAWHVPAGASHRAAGRGGPEGRGRPAAVLGGIRPDRVLSQLFFEQRDGCPRGVADDPGRFRPSRAGSLRAVTRVIAGRLAGAFRNIGRDRIADEIVKTMTAAGYAVRENDPFTDKPSLVIGARETSPYVNRLRLLWQKMREPVIERFPKAPGPPRNIEAYLKRVNDAYVTDAYHSLSIEGYRVTPALIERVRERHMESGSRRGRPRTAERHGGARLLAGLSGRAEKPRQNSEGGKSGRRSRTRTTARGIGSCSRRASPSAC